MEIDQKERRIGSEKKDVNNEKCKWLYCQALLKLFLKMWKNAMIMCDFFHCFVSLNPKHHHIFRFMTMQCSTFLTFLISIGILFSFQEQTISKPLKKIIIDSSNNVSLDDQYYYLAVPAAYNKKQVQMLKEFIQQRFKPRMQSDIQSFGL